MGADPITGPLLYIAMAGASAYAASEQRKSAPKPKTPGAPAAPVDSAEETAKKRKAYRPAAQMFQNEDLRLGAAGKLGL